MFPRGVLGLDVGGANLKAAHTNDAARTIPFALWRQAAALPDALRSLVRSLPEAYLLAVTMTGELCDCFPSKREGVRIILEAVGQVHSENRIGVWTNEGRFLSPDAALRNSLKVASANWLALATFAGRYAPEGPALLIDTGSTTTDIIPLFNGQPIPRGRTDPERLRFRELVYTGATRTPVCALLSSDGAAEFFATMHDVYLVLGVMPQEPENCDTADNRPATRSAAHARLARMLCADLETSTESERLALAELVANRQRELIIQSLVEVAASLPDPPRTVILSGSGAFVAERAWRKQDRFAPGAIVRLDEILGFEISQAACAYAVAVLAQEFVGGLDTECLP